MKKYIFCLIFLLFISGCTNKNIQINTFVEQDNNNVISINYPVTYTKLDRYIKKDIDSIYKTFKSIKNSNSELNIDYTYNKINGYISVGLFIYKNSSNSSTNHVITYNYDTKKNKLINIYDVTSDEDIINEFDTSNLKFTLSDEYLNIYSDTTTSIPLTDLNLKINLINNEKLKKVNIDISNKIIDPFSKVVAITFDDGPSMYTDDLIEYLNSEGCNATFFILGNKVKIYKDTLIKSIKYGNELGNHSYNHKWLIKLDEESFKSQITKTQDIIKEETGYTTRIMRPTYGSLNNKIKNNTNLDIVLWNVDTMDWKYKDVNSIVKRATKNLKDGNIILMHDTHKRTLDAVKKIVPIIKNKGFICVTASELKEIKILREKINE